MTLNKLKDLMSSYAKIKVTAETSSSDYLNYNPHTHSYRHTVLQLSSISIVFTKWPAVTCHQWLKPISNGICSLKNWRASLISSPYWDCERQIFTYLVSSMYTASRTDAAYSMFFLRSTTFTSPLSSCFTRHLNLQEKKKSVRASIHENSPSDLKALMFCFDITLFVTGIFFFKHHLFNLIDLYNFLLVLLKKTNKKTALTEIHMSL